MEKIVDTDNLLNKFNERDIVAFGKMYSLFYDDLFYYALKLYVNTRIEPQDAVHDAFLKLWQMPKTVFKTLVELKAYLFVIIRNDFKQFIRHSFYVEQYKKYELENTRACEFDILESELRGRCEHILGLLPRECAEIFRLFFEGLNTDEIALKLGKTKQTIYNKKHEAISILKKKISKEDIFLLMLFLG
ncbi:RNA polymerase sigma factor [Butyricimonas paravirosa]|uniref:RNA polymerase sigma factor n=1 Tax=Butyricimonas paravirosa TaxID=1472417 RepID=UPI00210E798D